MYKEDCMSSIRININSRAMQKQTSTTFTETFARFFLHAWFLKNDKKNSAGVWLIIDESAIDYEPRKIVARSFQTAVNQMISDYDESHGFNNDSIGRWTRDKIEYQLLTIISRTNNQRTLASK